MSCYCPTCRSVIDDFVAGGAAVIRPRASCPRCGSLERHRLLALVLDSMAPTLAAARVVLDVAPTAPLTPLVRDSVGGLYLPCDFDPAADGRVVILRCDLESLPLADDSVDVIICTQVLEHVPDDAAALREIRRVLSPGGVALVNIPYRAGTLTDEDPGVPEHERIRRFGQADHVRFYGDDFDDRLRAAGLGFSKASSTELCGEELVYRLGLAPTEMFWFVWKHQHHTAVGLPRFEALHAFAVMSGAGPMAPPTVASGSAGLGLRRVVRGLRRRAAQVKRRLAPGRAR